MWELSVLSSQFFCISKMVFLKKKNYLLFREKASAQAGRETKEEGERESQAGSPLREGNWGLISRL